MPALLEPVLQACREIYNLEGVMERYNAYVHLMTKARGEFLPLGAFSPMGKRQKAFLDGLLEQQAENHALQAAQAAMQELELPQTYRLALVVVDEPRNGWTQRHLTDAEWRFAAAHTMPKHNTPRIPEADWLPVQLWTTEFDGTERLPSLEYVRQETRAAVARAKFRQQHGIPTTLEQMMHQEGAVLRFSGEEIVLSTDELEYTRAVLEPLLESSHHPTNFAAMYGDEAAKGVGFAPLGVSARAGFALAICRFV
jgi:hypothetical protein